MYLLENLEFDRSQASAYVVSGGAVGLTLLLYDDPEVLYQRMRGTCQIMAELKTLGIFAPFHTARVCRLGLNYFLPDDAHIRLGDRVYVGLTHFPSLRPATKQGPFPTKEALVNALLASAFIPGFFANPFVPGFRGYIDGGFSHAYGPDPENSVVVTIGHYADSDVSYDDGRVHLQFSDAEGYMEIFWLGYASAQRGHDRIVAKLERQGFVVQTPR
jgi:hypothetical protein